MSDPMITMGPGGRSAKIRAIRTPKSPRPCGHLGKCLGQTRLLRPSISGETARIVSHFGDVTRCSNACVWWRYHQAALTRPMSLPSRVFTRPGCGSLTITTNLGRYLPEIVTKDPGIDAFQLTNLFNVDALIHLMHGAAHQPKFNNRTMVFDKPRVRRPT